MSDVRRADDLPEGSIVADRERVWHKTIDDIELPWIYTEANSMYVNNASDGEVDDVLAVDATVLRYGHGEEQPPSAGPVRVERTPGGRMWQLRPMRSDPMTDPASIRMADLAEDRYDDMVDASLGCDHGLVPLDTDRPVACVLPWGHGGLHRTPRGVQWVGDGDDDPEE